MNSTLVSIVSHGNEDSPRQPRLRFTWRLEPKLRDQPVMKVQLEFLNGLLTLS
jgi:hypothetical protein